MEKTQNNIQNSAKLSNAYNVWVMCKNYVADPTEGKQDLDKTYQSENKEVARFDTVGDFWSVYTHLRRPSAMQSGVNLHYFVEGVKPLWEDAQCANGGRWSVRLPKHLTGKVWEDMLLQLVGSQFGCSPTKDGKPEILGLILSIKQQRVDTISVWHRTASSAEVKEQIRKVFEETLNTSLEASKAMFEKLKEVETEEQRQQLGYTPYLPPTFKFQLDYDDFKEMLSQPAKPTKTWHKGEGGTDRGGRGRGRGGFSRGGYQGGGYRKPDGEDEEEFERPNRPQRKNMAQKPTDF